MKRILTILAALLVLGAASLHAQDTTRVAPVDSTLVGRDVFSVIGPGVQISQSSAVRQALQQHVRDNGKKAITGYRIRVYYENGPQARSRSAGIEESLRKQYPGIMVYRTFESPNYKVSIGDFRSKDEAQRIFQALKGTYPTAFIIKEGINYPR